MVVAMSDAGQRLRLQLFAEPLVPRDAVAPDADATLRHVAASDDDDVGRLLQLLLPLVAASDADVVAADDVAVQEADNQCPQ